MEADLCRRSGGHDDPRSSSAPQHCVNHHGKQLSIEGASPSGPEQGAFNQGQSSRVVTVTLRCNVTDIENVSNALHCNVTAIFEEIKKMMKDQSVRDSVREILESAQESDRQ